MNEYENLSYPDRSAYDTARPEVIVAELAHERPEREPVPAVARRRVLLPALLFAATCLSTLFVGSLNADPSLGWGHMLARGFMYGGALMTILIFHEAGHFLQARRYGVYATFPFFIPMPISPIGTFGAVIAMDPRRGDRKALFDIGISGPLAGLVPTLVFCALGLHWSRVIAVPEGAGGMFLGEPLLFKFLARAIVGPLPQGHDILLHPIAFAGWVGLLITALNLLPIGQLDGGHILYGLLRRRAHQVASALLLAAAVAVIWYGLWGWTLMLMLLALMGPAHPPTADDHVPLGTFRTMLGWATLAFIPIGFTPIPFSLG